MLSATNTITDVKARLSTYSVYGYASEELLTAALTIVAADVKMDMMIPAIGDATYDDLAAKDKVGLSTTDEYVYWAEIFFILARFMSHEANKVIEGAHGDSYSVGAQGYSQSVSGATSPGFTRVAWRHANQGKKYMAFAGYDVGLRLQRGGYFWTNTDSNLLRNME